MEAGGVEPIHAIENTQVADFGTPPIPLTPPIPSTFAQFCSLVPPEGLAAIVLLGNTVVLSRWKFGRRLDLGRGAAARDPTVRAHMERQPKSDIGLRSNRTQ